MKVCIVSLNAKYIHLAPAPYALGAGVLAYAQGRHDVLILDAVVGKGREDLSARIAAESPDAVAFSVYIWNVEQIKTLLPLVRASLPNATFILGGPEVSYAVEETFSAMPHADYILSGEGELPFAYLLDAMEGKRALADVPGCGYRTENGVFVPIPYIGEGTPPSPLAFGYAEALRGRIAYLEGARGCPFSCAFCLSGRAGGVRFFDMERVKHDILCLANADTRTIKFVDRTFNADRERARELWRFLIEKRMSGEIREGVCFHFEIAGELLDEETLTLLKTAPKGLFQMEIGLQSFHEPTLRAIRRSPHTEKLCQNILEILQNGNIHLHIDLIAGLPYEDLTSFRAGFDRAFALGAHMLQLGVLKLLRGAPMREEKEKFPCQYAARAPYTVLSTPALSEADLADIALCEEGCERIYNSGKYRSVLCEAIIEGAAPYVLLRDAGRALARLGRDYTLDDEVSLLLDFFANYMSPLRARDLILLDFLATNSSCYTPKALRREDAALARVKREIAVKNPPRAGVRRAVGILYSEGKAVCVDYDKKDPVTHRYEVKTVVL